MPPLVTVAQLRALCPHCDAETWAPALDMAFHRFAIVTQNRIAFFMAQTAEESGGYTAFEENLNYSAKALRAQWPSHFPTDAIAAQYARKPEAIANRAYASRMGNGDEASGDGWRFRGRSIIGITGRNCYDIVGQLTGLDCVNHPELLEIPVNGALATGAFWAHNNCNYAADRNDFIGETRLVNGGLIGLATREQMLTNWRRIIANEALK